MKNSIISFVIFAFTIVCIVFSLNRLSKIYLTLSSTCTEMQKNIRDENWDKADELCDTLIESWDSQGAFFSSFSSEEDLHSINDRLISLRTYITLKNNDEAMNFCNQVSFFLMHLKDMQKVNIENIF